MDKNYNTQTTIEDESKQFTSLLNAAQVNTMVAHQTVLRLALTSAKQQLNKHTISLGESEKRVAKCGDFNVEEPKQVADRFGTLMHSDLPSFDICEDELDELPSRLPRRASPIGISDLHTVHPVSINESKAKSKKRFSFSKTTIIVCIILTIFLLILLIALPILIYKNFHDCRPSTCVWSSSSPVASELLNFLMPSLYYISVKVYMPSFSFAKAEDDIPILFEGNTTIVMHCFTSTNIIYLHADGLNFTTSNVKLSEASGGNEVEIVKMEIHPKQQMIRLDTKWSLNAGSDYTLAILYKGTVSKQQQLGLYYISYTESAQMKYILATKSSKASARRWFPCFDEPHVKAKFQVELLLPAGMKGLSNGQEIREEQLGNGWTKIFFQITPKMSPHQLVIFASQYASKNIPFEHRKEIRIWTKPMLLEQTEFATSVVATVLSAVQNYLNSAIPVDKLDIIALPSLLEKEETDSFLGIVIVNELGILCKKENCCISAKKNIMKNIIKAFIHQWLDGVVTVRCWDDYWFLRSLAKILSYVILDKHDQNLDMEAEFIFNVVQQALGEETFTNSYTVKNAADFDNSISNNAENKGASILRMMYNIVGFDVFMKVMSTFIQKYANGNASYNEFFNILSEISQSHSMTDEWKQKSWNASQIVIPWIEQSSYPLVTVIRNYEDGMVQFKQSRFHMADKYDFGIGRWNIPVVFQHGPGAEKVHVWLTSVGEAKSPVPKAPYNYVLANVDMFGFCRIQYDEANWQLIQMQLAVQHDLISIKSRAQLLDDAFALAKVGKLNYALALDLTKYLPQENAYLPWLTASRHMSFFYDLLHATKYENQIKKFLIHIYEPIYHRLGFETSSKESLNLRELRSLIWKHACKFDLAHCIQTAKNLYTQYEQSCVESKSSSLCNVIPISLRQTVYCTSISEAGSSQEWTFLWRKFMEEEDVHEKRSLLIGLSCTKNAMLLNNLLEKALGGVEMNAEVVSTIFHHISMHNVGNGMLWDFTIRNWDALLKKFNNSSVLNSVVQAATRSFKTRKRLEALEMFLSSKVDVGTSRFTFKQQLEITRENIAWLEQYKDDVLLWIKHNVPDSSQFSIYR
ncbi:Aminopeptidase N [Trichinella pseudospiralis]|uniref:Aminopeptidase N n=3 Tax=Trichinella pseudospiralis TaxID=6337 RepID=A0A0V1IIA7_TRIPS|nr:Aminopeptidase N [Trichinella pseudospiralis]